MRGRQGTHVSYNAQATVDEQHGLIVENDVVNDKNDLNQFSKQINNANKLLETPCKTACADAGYSNIKDLKKIANQGIEVIVPNQKQALHNKKQKTGFEKEFFKYEQKENIYICPTGHKLRFSYLDKHKHWLNYRMAKPKDCLNCIHYGVCTTE